MLGKSISKNSMILGAFALVTAAILAITFQATADKIAEEERRAAEKALLEIVPAETHNNDMLTDTWAIPETLAQTLNLKDSANIHIARLNGSPVAAIIPAIAPDGYSGDIKVIVGVSISGTLMGVRVLSHKETPGLGDKVELAKSNWILSFNGKSLLNPIAEKWTVKKDGGDFDQFTGATITPRAVVHKVKFVLEFFEQHKTEIFAKNSKSTASEV